MEVGIDCEKDGSQSDVEKKKFFEIDDEVATDAKTGKVDSEAIIKEKPSYVFCASELIAKQVSEMPTLLKPFLPQVGIAVMAGSSDTGKSAWLRQLATAIVLNQAEFISFKLTATHHSAIYVSTEDDENSIAYLLKKQNGEQLTPEKFKGLRFIFETDNLLKRLNLELSRMPADIVIVDTLTDVFGSNDFNNALVVRSFLQQYQKLALKHQCLVVFNHHLAKAKEYSVPSKNAVLGSMAIESKARILLELRKDRFDNNLRHLIALKGNYLPAKDKQASTVLQFNEQMVFTNTGKTVVIEELAGSRNCNETGELKAKAAELKKKGESVRDIAKMLEKEFNVPVGKSTVGEWVKGVASEEPAKPGVD
ncbi:AAA family ATPase [Segetibacter koreensis]|uniref:AAA family ATPase n=1 Tax=Segetibacter koreensis TaxID=398037 RepID=UPI000364758D|nr:AAA family ATPase [Segetibacter koreensis]